MTPDVRVEEYRDRLQARQAAHVQFLEAWGDEFPRVRGVNLVRAFTYELVQFFNHAYLRELAG